MVQKYICPHTENCLVYKNWAEQTGDSRLEVISGIGIPNAVDYSCLALTAIRDPITEGGVFIDKILEKRLAPRPQEIKCSHIELLNRISKLSERLG